MTTLSSSSPSSFLLRASAISRQNFAKCRNMRRTLGAVVVKAARWQSLAFSRQKRLASVSPDLPWR